MIYGTDKSLFPEQPSAKEILSYMDENGFEWKIARVENGFFIAYFGHAYFMENTFDMEVNGKNILIRNTGCFFVECTDFDIFYHFRAILKKWIYR